MQQRTDPGAAKFLRPKFAQMIEWQFNRHNGLLLQHRNSRERVVAAVSAADLQAFDTNAPTTFASVPRLPQES